MKRAITISFGLLFGIGCSSGPVANGVQKANAEQQKPYTWGHFDFFKDDVKATYVNIGLSGGSGKFGLNIECLSRGQATQKMNAYVWVDKDELVSNADVLVKWDDSLFRKEHWGVSNRALEPPDKERFVNALITHNRLTVEYVPARQKKANVIVLPLAGAEAQLHQYCPVTFSHGKKTVLADTSTASRQSKR